MGYLTHSTTQYHYNNGIATRIYINTNNKNQLIIKRGETGGCGFGCSGSIYFMRVLQIEKNVKLVFAK
jgi:hypothetical protein